MSEPRALTLDQQSQLRSELNREDLSIYVAVRLARMDVSTGNFGAAIACLRIDSDKLRTVSPILTDLMACN